MAKKRNNSSKYIKFVVAIVLVIAVVFGIYYLFIDKNNSGENETISQSLSVSESASEAASSTNPSEAKKPAEESSSAVSDATNAPAPNTTTKQAKNYELPLSINQALNALEEHYGSEYSINATVEEDGINYFALYKDDEKYASVAVDLSTGEATETIMETNQKTDFYLV